MNIGWLQAVSATNIGRARWAVEEKGDGFVTQIAATLFFALVFIGAAAAIQVTARQYWFEILTALRGELGLDVRAAAAPRAQPQPQSREVPQRAAA